jgi:exodeoxyribonuclease VII large subunit
MAADWRAATPTMAGERAVPVLADLSGMLHKEERRLDRELEMRFRSARQELDQLATRTDGIMSNYVARRRALLAKGMTRLEACHPRAQLATRRGDIGKLDARLAAAARARLDKGRRRFSDLASRLGAMSPLRVLERGYAIASSGDRVLVDGREVDAGDKVSVRLSRGVLDCTVDAVTSDDHQEDD